MNEAGHHSKKARMELICSMTVFGTIGIFVRGIPLPSGELALYRAAHHPSGLRRGNGDQLDPAV